MPFPDLDRLDRIALEVFLESGTQWTTSFGGLVGLNYSGVKAVAEALDIEWSEELLSRIQICEGLILKQEHDRAAEKK